MMTAMWKGDLSPCNYRPAKADDTLSLPNAGRFEPPVYGHPTPLRGLGAAGWPRTATRAGNDACASALC